MDSNYVKEYVCRNVKSLNWGQIDKWTNDQISEVTSDLFALMRANYEILKEGGKLQ